MTCAGCEARDREIAWLRAQVEKLQDRPAPVVPIAPPPPAPLVSPQDEVPPILVHDGVQYVVYQGRTLLKSDWDRMLAGQGFIDPGTGTFVSNDEFARANAMLDAQVGAGRN